MVSLEIAPSNTLWRLMVVIMTDENLDVLRRGCLKYFHLGGEAVNGPVSLLSA
jgi:uncharacterized protein YuzB (UPF0349 family)